MLIGYARVSRQDQNLDRQTDELTRYGCERIYKEKITGAKTERIELQKMLDQLRQGDVIVITELTRLSRSVKDLFSLVDIIESKGSNIKSLKEIWLDTTTPQGKLLFTIFAGISEFERGLISQRTKEGLASAKERGRKGGRPPIDRDKIKLAITMYKSKLYSVSDITKETGISKSSLYRAMKD